MAAMVGSNVNFRCHLEAGSKNVSEINLYWYMPGVLENDAWIFYPGVSSQLTSIFKKNSSFQTNPNHKTDMSLTVTNVSLFHTGTYVCYTSLRINQNKTQRSGNGTSLLVYEQINISTSNSNLICSTRVKEVENVILAWECDGESCGTSKSGFHQKKQRLFWISNPLDMGANKCPDQQNVTAVCLLHYMGHSLMNKSIQVPCPSTKGPLTDSQTIHLYGWIFGAVLILLLLIILILVWSLRKQKLKNTEIETAVYTNVPSNARFGILKPSCKG
ncbi:uncharacterized protein [Hyperolius riggenbachi]|uniref:uncharacterized protein n=1 Tax=Hyperolius riggenbachi TaxID=752182 RepID=UPI0035A3B993